MTPVRRAAALAALASLLLAGCALFEAEKPKPKPLEPIVAPIAVQQVWRQELGAVDFPVAIAVDGDSVLVATTDGSIVAVEAASGRTRWRASVGARVGAGVGSDGKRVAVVTRDGDLVVVQDGQVKWKKPFGGRVATAPLLAGERVFVLGVDRSVQAFDADDGTRLWRVSRPGDPLTLAQEGVIAAFRNTLVVGQGPRLAGLDPAGGSVRWEAVIGAPRGANEVERLADLVGPPLRIGDLVCARSFQAAVGCVDAERGRVSWTRNTNGGDAIGGDAELVFGADAADRISAWKASSGDVAWSSEALMFRGLGAPQAYAGSVVFGDDAGTLHWFSKAKGESQARVPTDGGAVVARPVVVDGTLVVLTRRGGLFGFRAPG